MEVDRQPFLKVTDIGVASLDLASLKGKKKLEYGQYESPFDMLHRPGTPLFFVQNGVEKFRCP